MANSSDSARKLWSEAFERLQGREIFPPDRESFVFDPLEILGIAFGVAECDQITTDQREWLANTILRGINSSKFRTGLSQMVAIAAMRTVGGGHVLTGKGEVAIEALSTADLLTVAEVSLACKGSPAAFLAAVEEEFAKRVLGGIVTVNDPAEAAAASVLMRNLADGWTSRKGLADPLDLVLMLCRRFPLYVERLARRQRGRPPFQVADEYDVQDALHAILKLHFDDVRAEEHTPSYAGNASRIDFVLPRERIAIEAKMTRRGLGQRQVTDELIIDAARYKSFPEVDCLVCLVYDPERHCATPQALEADLEHSSLPLKVKAIVCPTGI